MDGIYLYRDAREDAKKCIFHVVFMAVPLSRSLYFFILQTGKLRHKYIKTS